jgi:hypothetical protein
MGSDDVKNTSTAEIYQGVSSVFNTDSSWGLNQYFNGTVLADQLSDIAINVGELISMRSNGKWALTDSSTTNAQLLLGICLNTVTGADEYINVLLEGQVSTIYHEELSTAVAGKPLYAAQGVAGSISEFAPIVAGQTVRLIGHNILNGSDYVYIRFDPDNSWIEL